MDMQAKKKKLGLRDRYAAMTRGLHWDTTYQPMEKVFPYDRYEGIKIHDWDKWEDPFRLTVDAYWKYQAEKERKLYAIIDAFSQNNGHLTVTDARYVNALKLWLNGITPLEYEAHKGYCRLGREFKGSLFAIAKDVKIQIEFNPKHVQAYRLIGYENRKLKAEDFKNDAVDAGELGSGHTVTALYEIIPVGVDSDFVPSDLKYTKVKTDSESQYNEELATIKFRYKKPDGEKSIEMIKTIADQAISLEQSSRDFKFSSAVAWFGLKLRDSKYLSEKSTDAIKRLAQSGLSYDEDGYKAEFIRLVETVN